MHSPTPSFTEEQILFLLQRLDILHFLEQSCSYVTIIAQKYNTSLKLMTAYYES